MFAFFSPPLIERNESENFVLYCPLKIAGIVRGLGRRYIIIEGGYRRRKNWAGNAKIKK